MKNLVIYANKKRESILLLVNLGLVFLGISTARSYILSATSLGRILAPISILISLAFLFTSYLRLNRLLKKSFILKIDDQGIYSSNSIMVKNPHYIQWHMIEELGIQYYYNQAFITIYLKDNESFLKDKNLMERLLIKKYLKHGFGAFNLATELSYELPLNDLLMEIKKRSGLAS